VILVDTSAWIALEDKKDVNHPLALEFKQELLVSRDRLVTTNYILDETFTLMLIDLGYTRTVKFKRSLDDLILSNLILIVHVTPEIERTAWDTFERFNKDKTWSFTDCTSKVVMELLGVSDAFTFDRHFEQMSFVKKP